MGLDAGSLDRRIRLLRYGEIEDPHGDAVAGFAPLTDRWAAKRPGGGRERFAGAEVAASAVTVFTIRWDSSIADLNPKDKLEYPIGERRYDIVAVEEIGRREGYTIATVAAAD